MKVVTFLVITFVLSSIFYTRMISTGEFGDDWYSFGLMWCPGIAALLTQLIYNKNLRNLGWGWGKTRYQATSYIIPFLVCSVVYIPVWLSGFGGVSTEKLMADVGAGLGLDGPASLGMSVGVKLTIVFLMCCVAATGEEIGWRGFLVPHLAQKTTFAKTAVISGAVWAVWHYPLFFVEFGGDALPLFGIACYTISIIGKSFVLVWLRLRSGSLWTGVVLHGSHNLFLEGFFNDLTIDTERTKFITTDFGIGLMIAYALFAVVLWKRRSEVGLG